MTFLPFTSRKKGGGTNGQWLLMAAEAHRGGGFCRSAVANPFIIGEGGGGFSLRRPFFEKRLHFPREAQKQKRGERCACASRER